MIMSAEARECAVSPQWQISVAGASLISELAAHTLVLAHRRELLTQTSAKLSDAGVSDHAILAAGFPFRPLAPVEVAAIQTLHARGIRTRKIDLPKADLVVVDEAHHCRAPTYERILEAYPEAIPPRHRPRSSCPGDRFRSLFPVSLSSR
jgi:superfamily II DNA or RNA helicase